MALYLIHTPLIYWIKIALHGEIGIAVVGKNPEVEFPAWPAIPLHITGYSLSDQLNILPIKPKYSKITLLF